MENNKNISESTNSNEEWVCPICQTKNNSNNFKCINCNNVKNVVKYNIDDPLNPEYEKEIENIFNDIPTVKSIAIENSISHELNKQNYSWECPNCKKLNDDNFCPNCGTPKPK